MNDAPEHLSKETRCFFKNQQSNKKHAERQCADIEKTNIKLLTAFLCKPVVKRQLVLILTRSPTGHAHAVPACIVTAEPQFPGQQRCIYSPVKYPLFLSLYKR